MIGRVGTVTAAMGIAACISIDPFHAQIVATDGADGLVIEAPAYKLHFSGMGGARFLDSITVTSGNLLGSDPTQESFAGIGAPASFLVDATRMIAGSTHVTLEGPGAAQVVSVWNRNGVDGTMTITAYPDGRIVRHDDVSVGPLLPAGASYLTSYIAFQNGALGMSHQVPAPLQGSDGMHFDGGGASVNWLAGSGGPTAALVWTGDSTQQHRIHPNANNTAFVYDWVRPPTAISANTVYSLTTTLLMSSPDLYTNGDGVTLSGPDLDARLRQLSLLPASLDFTQDGVNRTVTALDPAGSYGYQATSLSPVYVTAVAGGAQRGFAISITFEGATSITVDDPAPEGDATPFLITPDPSSPGRFIIWFKNVLMASGPDGTQNIVITPHT